MKKIFALILACLVFAACAQTPPDVPDEGQSDYREFYRSESENLVAVVDLHTEQDWEKLLENALENYGLNFTKDDLSYIGENGYNVNLIIPKNTDVTVRLKTESETIDVHYPVVVHNYNYMDIFAVDKEGNETKLYFGSDMRRGDNVDLLTDKLLFSPELYNDGRDFLDTAGEMGYTIEMLNEIKNSGYWQNEDEYRTYILTYGKSMRTAEGHDCLGQNVIHSPNGDYTLRYSAYTWGGSYSGYVLYVDNNTTGTSQIVDINGWFNNQKYPVFTDDTHFVSSNGKTAGFYSVENPSKPTNTFKVPDEANYEIASVYSNTRDGNIVISWSHIPKDGDTVDKPSYYYNFTITDYEGNVIKELSSNLGASFTVGGIAQPEFKVYDGQHPEGKLKTQLWKFGTYTLDLTTGNCEKAE